MDVFSLAALTALVVKLTSATKYLTSKNYGEFLTQIYVWGIGVGLAFVATNANAMSKINVNGVALGSLDGWSAVLFGLGLSSVGSFAYDVKKARDNSDSAAEPALLPNT